MTFAMSEKAQTITAAQLLQEEETKKRLLQMVSGKIVPRRDAVDLGIATDNEKYSSTKI